jgi:hypothetical protein
LALLVIALLVKTVPIWYNYLSMLQEVYQLVRQLELKAISKMLVATCQILGNLSDVLSITLPDVFTDFLESFVSFFKFDFIGMLKLGCVSTGSYFAKLGAAVGLLVAIMGVVILDYWNRMRKLQSDHYMRDSSESAEEHLRELYEQFDVDGTGIDVDEVYKIVRKVDPATPDQEIEAMFKKADSDGGGKVDYAEFRAAVIDANVDDGATLDLAVLVQKKAEANIRDEAVGRLFLVVFLMYPGLTNKIIEGFSCRKLGEDASVMSANYSSSCESDEYMLVLAVCSLLTAVWAIGIPAVLFYEMYKVREFIEQGDPDTLQKFEFVLGDYDQAHWYWEVVELTRKLVLAGLIGLAGRGTVFQTVVATLISFMFFALAFREQPFESKRLNLVKICSEFQLFGILLICVVLQSSSVGGIPTTEILRNDGYGICQLILTVGIVPITMYVLRMRVLDMREKLQDLADGLSSGDLVGSEEFENPNHGTFELEEAAATK